MKSKMAMMMEERKALTLVGSNRDEEIEIERTYTDSELTPRIYVRVLDKLASQTQVTNSKTTRPLGTSLL